MVICLVLCYGGTFGKTIVFTQTKAEANELYLSEKLKDIEVLHGDIPQQQREITFRGFKEGRFHILVATDVASRGLDIPDVDLIVQCEPPKDVETYIHRSGRTARAGKEGTVVTFYTKKHAPLISRIEKTAGIVFSKIGAPQPEDIIKASSKFIIKGLKKVQEEALPLFKETAELLAKEFGERKALLLTLAYISGNLNKIKKRSMLSGTEDYVTYQLETEKDFRTVSYIWGILRRLLPGDDAEQIRQMRCYRNYKGAAFDVPEKLQVQFEAAYEHEKTRLKFMTYVVKKSTELPDLKEFEQVGGYGSYGGYGNDRGGSSYGGGYQDRSRDNRDFHHHSPQVYDSHTSHHHDGYEGRGHEDYKDRQHYSKGPMEDGGRDGHHEYRKNDSSGQPRQAGNEIFMWGLKTEDDIKEFLMTNKVGWQRVKVLTDEKGESKLAAFVTVDKDDVEPALKLTGSKVNGRQLRITLASDKPKR